MSSLSINSEAVRDLPPSAKLVYLVLQEDGPLTQADLIDQTALPERTARFALDELADADVVTERPFAEGDARKSLYTVRSRQKNK